jgi:hypothetical protein
MEEVLAAMAKKLRKPQTVPTMLAHPKEVEI